MRRTPPRARVAAPGRPALRTGLLALAVVAVTAAGCVPPPPEPITTVVLPEDAAAILAARDALDEDVVAVVAGVTALAEAVDEARHGVPRGQPQADALAAVGRRAEAVAEDSTRLAGVAATLVDPAVAEAAALSGRLAAIGGRAADAAVREVADVEPFVAFDQQLDAAVEAWGRRGSRSEQAAAFPALVDDAVALVRQARRLPGDRCPDLRTNRIRWAQLVAERTAELRDLALQAEGAAFDQRRAAFERGPYGEDRQVADSEAAACWARRSALPGLAAAAQEVLDRLPEALDG